MSEIEIHCEKIQNQIEALGTLSDNIRQLTEDLKNVNLTDYLQIEGCSDEIVSRLNLIKNQMTGCAENFISMKSALAEILESYNNCEQTIKEGLKAKTVSPDDGTVSAGANDGTDGESIYAKIQAYLTVISDTAGWARVLLNLLHAVKPMLEAAKVTGDVLDGLDPAFEALDLGLSLLDDSTTAKSGSEMTGDAVADILIKLGDIAITTGCEAAGTAIGTAAGATAAGVGAVIGAPVGKIIGFGIGFGGAKFWDYVMTEQQFDGKTPKEYIADWVAEQIEKNPVPAAAAVSG